MAVKSKMGTPLSRRSDWVKAKPLSPGIMMSTIKRSNSIEFNLARASAASRPVVTRNPWSLKYLCNSSRSLVSSSTTNMCAASSMARPV
jgi:hypothetical protein